MKKNEKIEFERLEKRDHKVGDILFKITNKTWRIVRWPLSIYLANKAGTIIKKIIHKDDDDTIA